MSKSAGFYAGHGIDTAGKYDSGTTYKKDGVLYKEADLVLAITTSAVKYMRASGIEVHTDPKNKINMKMQVKDANTNKVDVFVSVHCDYKKAPTGTMPLYTSAKGKKLAKTLNKHVMADMNMKTRGVTKRTDLYELNATNMVSCIFETGSIKADLGKLKQADKYGKALAKGVCEYMGVAFKTTTTMPKTTSNKKVYGKTVKRPLRGYFKSGDKGTKVKGLQEALVWLGYKFSKGITKKYDTETISKVKAFQKKHGLTIDGQWGKDCNAKFVKVKR